ncbi:acyl carrier protein [Nonomuraea guangzhouensis]|uniref:Acyl carrier protein n=1 Tax=Nonomuraea guangzhouensis TaxID=1291555 RepID=A0ABW4FY02_9ACTN|nr:acyl carrier protein [Nonomuraea guangzhouensis]
MPSHELPEDLARIVADVTDLPAEAITPGSCFQDLGEWSSLAALRLLTAVEEHFGIRLELRRYLDTETVGELSDMIAGSAEADR